MLRGPAGQWLDMLGAVTPGAVVKLVGTKHDVLHPPPQDEEEEEEVKTLMSSYHDFNILYAASEGSR